MEGAVYLADAWRFVVRGRAFVLVGALLAAIVAAVVVASSPKLFRAAALLTVVSERPSAEFSPPMLSSEGALRLLKSRPVMVETFRRAESRVGQASAQTSRLNPSLLTSRRGEVGNASLLELTVESPSAEEAHAVANAWAEVYLELDLRQSRMAAMRTGFHELLSEEQKALDKMDTVRLRLGSLESELAKVPPTLTLRSRLTDRELLEGAKDGVLVTQEPNPLYNQLASDVAAIRGDLAGNELALARVVAARKALKDRLDQLQAATAVGRDDSLNTLVAEPVLGALLPEYGSAQLLSSAVAPRHPEPRHALAKIVLATLGGAILGLLLAALREAVSVLPPAGGGAGSARA